MVYSVRYASFVNATWCAVGTASPARGIINKGAETSNAPVYPTPSSAVLRAMSYFVGAQLMYLHLPPANGMDFFDETHAVTRPPSPRVRSSVATLIIDMSAPSTPAISQRALCFEAV